MEFVKGGFYRETFTPEMNAVMDSIFSHKTSGQMIFRVDVLRKVKIEITLLEPNAFGFSVTGFRMQLTKYHFQNSILEPISLV